MSIFEHEVTTLEGSKYALSALKAPTNKAFLIVNLARKWGKTRRNLEELKILHERHAGNGLVILGFPCNNFGSQEPGTNDDVKKWWVDDNGCNFMIFGKIQCDNNDSTHPLFKALKSNTGGGGLGWNFHKFICDKDGTPTQRGSENPLELEDTLIAMLK